MEELETSVEMQEVAEPETQVEETQTEPVVEQAETEEVAKPQQTPEENAAFARMRREQEQARREAEIYRKQAERWHKLPANSAIKVIRMRLPIR